MRAQISVDGAVVLGVWVEALREVLLKPHREGRYVEAVHTRTARRVENVRNRMSL